MYIRTYVNQYTTRRTVHQKVRFDDTENYVKTWLQWRGFARFTFRDGAVPWIYVMGVSENRGTPKSSILKGFSVINHPFWGTPIFGSTHISQKLYARRFPPHHTTTSKFYLTINPLENEDIKTTQPTTQTATCGQTHTSHSQSPKSQTKCIQFKHHYRSHEISIPSSSPGPIHPACSHSL